MTTQDVLPHLVQDKRLLLHIRKINNKTYHIFFKKVIETIAIYTRQITYKLTNEANDNMHETVHHINKTKHYNKIK